MLVRIVSRKQALVQKAFSVPDVVRDLSLLLLGAEAAVFDLHRYDLFRERAFVIGHKEDALERDLHRAFDGGKGKCLIRFPRGKVFLFFQAAVAPLVHGAEEAFVDKQASAFARAARAALVSYIMHAVHAKAVRVKMLAQSFEVDGLAAFGLKYIIELDVDDGKGVGVAVLIRKGEFLAADARVCLFQRRAVQRVVQEHLEQPKTGVATSFGQLNPDRGAVFHFSLINIRRLDGQNAISILHGYSIT